MTAATPSSRPRLEIHPADRNRWRDLEALFGRGGAYSGCWCMFWRLKSAEFAANGNAGNKRALRTLIARGDTPGLLAYADGVPVGWVSLAPREAFPRLERSPKLRRVDDRPVWSIVCFFIARSHRHQGVMRALLDAAVAHVRRRGGGVVEAYPVETDDFSGCKGFTGVVSTFRRAGFVAVAPPVNRQVVMRHEIRP